MGGAGRRLGACGKGWAGNGEWDWRSHCGRGKVPSGAEPGQGQGRGRTLSTRPSGLSSVARAMVFTCNV